MYVSSLTHCVFDSLDIWFDNNCLHLRRSVMVMMMIMTTTTTTKTITVITRAVKDCVRQRLRTSARRIWSRCGLFTKFNGNILVWWYVCDRILIKIWSLSTEIRAKLWKNSCLAMLKNPFKKCLDPEPETDDFQHVTSSSLSTDMFVVKFSWKSVQ